VLSAVALADINPPGCGQRPLISVHPTEKVVGGHTAVPGDWGWMSTMRRNGGFICGGSVIDDRWILTAAHCPFGNANPAVYIMDIGIHDRNNHEAWGISHRVDLIRNHEQYSSATLRHDISLMRLANKLVFDNFYIIPVCIPNGDEDWQNTNGWATGWGTLFSGGSVSRYLMQVHMRHLTHTRCKARFGTSVDTDLQMCGGDVGEGIDTCQGDSGGPYVFLSKKPHHTVPTYYLVGLTSWGYGCGDGGVYTRVSGYYNWIVSTMNTHRPPN